MKRQKKQIKEENWLTGIPILGYFFRKIKENREAIEKTLKTGKQTEGETKRGSFLWIFKTASDKTFRLLKFKRTKKK